MKLLLKLTYFCIKLVKLVYFEKDNLFPLLISPVWPVLHENYASFRISSIELYKFHSVTTQCCSHDAEHGVASGSTVLRSNLAGKAIWRPNLDDEIQLGWKSSWCPTWLAITGMKYGMESFPHNSKLRSAGTPTKSPKPEQRDPTWLGKPSGRPTWMARS